MEYATKSPDLSQQAACCSSMREATERDHDSCMRMQLKKMQKDSGSPQVFADVSAAIEHAFKKGNARNFTKLIYWGAVCSKQLVMEMAVAGQLKFLNLACKDPTDACVAAAEAGRLDCLTDLLQSCPIHKYPKVAAAAAATGKVKCLNLICQLARDKATRHAVEIAAARAAAAAGADSCLQYLLEERKVSVDAEMLAAAAECVDTRCIQRLVKSETQWNILHTAALASRGPMRALQDLVDAEQPGRRAPFDSSTLAAAASGGRLDSLEYFKSKVPDPEELKSLLSAIVTEAAARNGKLVCLEQVCKWGGDWGQTTFLAAAYGHDDCLKFALKQQCPAPPAVAAMAARIGNIGALELIRTSDYIHDKWDCSATAAAASYNQYDCLRWLVKHNCPLWTSTVAASPYTMGVLHGQAAMLVANGDVNARVLMFAKRYRAPLPPDAEAEVRERRKRAITLAACFWKASQLLENPQGGEDAALWAAMHRIQGPHLEDIAKRAVIWVEKLKPEG